MSVDIGLVKRVFNLSEAQKQFPFVQSITQKHQQELSPLQQRLSKMLSNDPRRNALERDYESVVHRWRTKIEQLGASVSGLWIVEFNLGEGCLSWRHPELSLNYFRSHHASFAERVVLQDYIEANDPDWVR
ncbi:MAG: hypothetical protein ACI9FR_000815 [Cryomorphaceae bacterium]|jgi:hypothetical protein